MDIEICVEVAKAAGNSWMPFQYPSTRELCGMLLLILNMAEPRWTASLRFTRVFQQIVSIQIKSS
jgi:hypothetical protein